MLDGRIVTASAADEQRPGLTIPASSR